MIETERANEQLFLLLSRLHGWLPEDVRAEMLSCWGAGDPADTYARLCDVLTSGAVVIPRHHYTALSALGEALMFPRRVWQQVPVYLS